MKFNVNRVAAGHNQPLQQTRFTQVSFLMHRAGAAELQRYWAMSAAIASFRFQPETEEY